MTQKSKVISTIYISFFFSSCSIEEVSPPPTKTVKTEQNAAPAPVAAQQSTPAAPIPTPSRSQLPPEIRYQYYQSPTSVNISVLAKNLTPDDLQVEFQPTHLKVVVRIESVEGLPFLFQDIYGFCSCCI